MKRWIFRTLVRLTAALALLLALAWAALHTAPGRIWSAEYINGILRAPRGVYPQVEGLGGLWPWWITAERITLWDDEGPWLWAKNCQARLERVLPLRRRLQWKTAETDYAVMLRLPAPTADPPEATRAPGRPPARDGWDVTVQDVLCRHFRMNPPIAPWPVTGRWLRGHVHVSGLDAAISSRLEAEEVRILSQRWQARGDLNYEIAGKAFLRAEAWNQADHVSAWWVRLHEDDPGRVTAEASLQAVETYHDLADLAGLAGPADVRCTIESHEGTSRVTINARSPAMQWLGAGLEGVWMRAETDLPWGEGLFRAQGRIRSLGGEAWSARDVRVQSDMQKLAGPVQVTARWNMPKEAELLFRGHVGLAGEEVTIGAAAFSLAGDGLHLHTLRSPDITWHAGRLSARNLDIALNGARFHGELSYHAEEASQADIAFEKAPLSMLAWVGAPELDGSVYGRLAVDGPWWAPAGHLDVAVEAFAYPPLAGTRFVPSAFSGRFDIEPRQIRVTAHASADPLLPFALQLMIPLRQEERQFPVPDLLADWKARVSLSREQIAWRMLDEQGRYEWRGSFGAELLASGAPAHPRLDGEIFLRQGGLRDTFSGIDWEPAQILVTVTQNHFRIAQARVDSPDGGFLQADGFLDWKPEDPLSGVFTLWLSEFTLLQESFGRVSVSGRMTAEKNETPWSLEGDLAIEPTALSIPRSIPPWVTDIEVVDINTPPGFEFRPPDRQAARLAAEWNLPINIRARTRDKIDLAGRGLNSEWRGHLHLGGTTAQPKIDGQATLQRGTLFLMGRRFEIQQAHLLLTETSAGDPLVYIKARTMAAGLTIELEISGPVSNPQITLRSSPDLPENEVLSHLLFGRSTDQISPLQALTLAYNVNLLAGDESLWWILERGQATLGIDQMELVLDDQDSGIAAITVGKYLGPRLYLEGQKGIGGSEDEVALEYFITPSISIRTSTSPGIREGIGLRWQREF